MPHRQADVVARSDEATCEVCLHALHCVAGLTTRVAAERDVTCTPKANVKARRGGEGFFSGERVGCRLQNPIRQLPLPKSVTPNPVALPGEAGSAEIGGAARVKGASRGGRGVSLVGAAVCGRQHMLAEVMVVVGVRCATGEDVAQADGMA